MNTKDAKEFINRRRRQVLIHSCIYYRLDSNLIDDYTYDLWCKDLVDMQSKYPELSKQVPYAYYFSDFDGSTGMDLPIGNPEIMSRSLHLLNYVYKR